MKNKKSYCLIAIVITVVIALLVFVCLNLRIMRVDKVKIADDNVRAWLEEIADKEKAKSSTSELFIYIHMRILTILTPIPMMLTPSKRAWLSKSSPCLLANRQ